MNTLTACNYNNCFLQFKNVFDYIGHYEAKHLPDNEWRRVRDVEELEKAIENASDGREKEKLQEHLNILYNQPLRISLFYKLDPYPPEHVITPQEKKPLTLQFTNYRKRPAINLPAIVTPKKSIKNINNVSEVASVAQSVDERKHHCTVEGCKKSYKNSAGLRSHMRSVHNLSAQQQQQTRTSVSPAPNYAASNAHIAYVPSNQGYYAPKEEIKPVDNVVTPSGSIGSLATFNASTSRLHSSDDSFAQPGSVNYRASSRLTPSEENILNRNLTTLPSTPQRAGTPSSNTQPPIRMQDGKYKCDYCPKTYKANSNLQKHINDHHARQINLDATSNQRPVLSKNVLRTYSIGSNQQQPGGSTLTSQQQPPMQSAQQSKSNLLTTKSGAHSTTRAPASPSLVAHSPNLSPAPHISVQPTSQRQIAVGNQSNVQQRAYIQTRTYAPPQSQNQPIYHLQQIQQPGETPQSLDIQIPQNQASASPRSYSSSPVTVVLQHDNAAPTVQGQQQVPTEHYQQGPSGPNVRPPAARTYTSQQYYERYQNSVQQRRPANKNYGTGNYAYQPKQIKQVYRQASGQDYPRLAAPTSGPMNRVNTISSTGQPVRITSLNAQSGGQMMSSMSGSSGQMVSGSNTQMPTTYQVRTNYEGSRRSPQVSSGSLSSQLAPLNVNYGNTTTTTTSIDGIQITKVTPSQYGNPRTAIRTGSNAVRGRLPDNVRGGQIHSQGMTRYGAQPQYTQRIMRVVQQSPGNPPVLQQQQEPSSQRVLHHQPVSSQHSHQSNASDN